MKLNTKAFALTCGLFLGFALFLIAWWIMLFEGPTNEVTFIGRCYRGYSITPIGSVIGLVWGLIDGAIGGAIFAWLYNCLAKKLTCSAAQESNQG